MDRHMDRIGMAAVVVGVAGLAVEVMEEVGVMEVTEEVTEEVMEEAVTEEAVTDTKDPEMHLAMHPPSVSATGDTLYKSSHNH